MLEPHHQRSVFVAVMVSILIMSGTASAIVDRVRADAPFSTATGVSVTPGITDGPFPTLPPSQRPMRTPSVTATVIVTATVTVTATTTPTPVPQCILTATPTPTVGITVGIAVTTTATLTPTLLPITPTPCGVTITATPTATVALTPTMSSYPSPIDATSK